MGFLDMLGMKVKFGKYEKGFVGKEREIIDDVVKPIINLRNLVEFHCKSRESSSLLGVLTKSQHEEFALQPKIQNWSDGLVLYSPIDALSEKFSIPNVLRTMRYCGISCFFGLASEVPIRGAIEMDWAVEIDDGDIFGRAVAASYKLESDVAGYPRIVIGKKLLELLERARGLEPTNIYEEKNRDFADKCLKWIIPDLDGYYMVDYLQPGFFGPSAHDSYRELLVSAYEFIQKEYSKHRSEDTKLAMRYSWLREYFVSRLPALGVLLEPSVSLDNLLK
ncbi:MAG: hypothetical protein EOP48_27575 [Sphingobacteriales bacterium]|nr:MAG: hypothetical protein EOP48_27575 [Sphingobacteriales bacterium]